MIKLIVNLVIWAIEHCREFKTIMKILPIRFSKTFFLIFIWCYILVVRGLFNSIAVFLSQTIYRNIQFIYLNVVRSQWFYYRHYDWARLSIFNHSFLFFHFFLSVLFCLSLNLITCLLNVLVSINYKVLIHFFDLISLNMSILIIHLWITKWFRWIIHWIVLVAMI